MKQTKSKKTISKSSRTSRTTRTPKKNVLQRSLRFLPALVLFATALSIQGLPNFSGNSSRVLSYATSMNSSELLSSTNGQRAANGAGNLSLNSKLTSAAQAKANDMVARNYWSHNTPDGEEPWAFIARAGYQYRTAGENLAYGFANGADTVTGWMNSPPHRENLLNSSFLEVGFGFANSSNYVSNGEQTIVVAMYGTQLQAAPVASTTPSTPAPQPQTKPAASAPTPTPAPVEEPIQTAPEPVTKEPELAAAPTETTTNTEPVAAAPTAAAQDVSRIQVLTGGNARWSSTLLVLALAGTAMLWVLQRGRQIRQLLLSGERFILHHVHLDLTVVGFITLGYTLLQTTGTIR